MIKIKKDQNTNLQFVQNDPIMEVSLRSMTYNAENNIGAPKMRNNESY